MKLGKTYPSSSSRSTRPTRFQEVLTTRGFLALAGGADANGVGQRTLVDAAGAGETESRGVSLEAPVAFEVPPISSSSSGSELSSGSRARFREDSVERGLAIGCTTPSSSSESTP